MTEVLPVWFLPSKTHEIWNLTTKLHFRNIILPK